MLVLLAAAAGARIVAPHLRLGQRHLHVGRFLIGAVTTVVLVLELRHLQACFGLLALQRFHRRHFLFAADAYARQQLHDFVQAHPRIRTLVEYRARLADVLESRGHDASERLHRLQAWCAEAEASGVRVLQDYSARLKGYALQAA